MSGRPFVGIRDDTLSLANLQRHCVLLDANGYLKVISGGASAPVAAADDMANPTAPQELSYNFVYDGTAWDRWRGTSVAGAGNVTEQLAPGAEDNTNNVIAGIPRLLATNTYVPSVNTNKGSVNSASVKATAGNVFKLRLYNTNAAARFAFLCNIATAPIAATASLLMPISVPPSGLVTLVDFGVNGIQFTTGIGIAFMTTIAGGTLATAGECFWDVDFK